MLYTKLGRASNSNFAAILHRIEDRAPYAQHHAHRLAPSCHRIHIVRRGRADKTKKFAAK